MAIVRDFRNRGESKAADQSPTDEVLVGQLLIQAVRESDAYLEATRQARASMAAFQAELKEIRKVMRQAGKWVWEAAEPVGSVHDFQHGEKDRLWRWVEKRSGSKPDTIFVADLRQALPPITGDTDAVEIFDVVRTRAEGQRIRVERQNKVRGNEERSQRVYASLSKGNDRDYMQALAGYGDKPKEMLKRVLRGVVYSLGEDLPPEILVREAQKLIKDDNRLLWQTRKLKERSYGEKERQILSLDSPGKEFGEPAKEPKDELDLAFFLRVQDERRQRNLMKRADLTPREWQIVEFQREL